MNKANGHQLRNKPRKWKTDTLRSINCCWKKSKKIHKQKVPLCLSVGKLYDVEMATASCAGKVLGNLSPIPEICFAKVRELVLKFIGTFRESKSSWSNLTENSDRARVSKHSRGHGDRMAWTERHTDEILKKIQKSSHMIESFLLLLFCFLEYVQYLYMCKGRWGHWIPQKCNYRQLWAAM